MKLLLLIGAAVTPILLVIPFIGPFLAIAVDTILLAIGIAGVTDSSDLSSRHSSPG